MTREIDEAWVEEAITRYRRIDQLREQFRELVSRTEVTVHSPDKLVEVVVCADGTIRRVTVVGDLHGRTNDEVSRAVEAAVTSAADAARWARRTLYAETFAGYPSLEEL